MVVKIVKILKILALGDSMAVKNLENFESLEIITFGDPLIVEDFENHGNLENTGGWESNGSQELHEGCTSWKYQHLRNR